MSLLLSYREAQFSPGEAAACTTVSLAMQRDWRRHGHLRPKTAGQDRFSPRELAELSVMATVRGLGANLAESRSLGERAASSVLYLALSTHTPRSLAVDADSDAGARYAEVLYKQMEEQLFYTISGADPYYSRYILLQGGECKLLPHLDDDPFNNRIKASAAVHLEAIAAEIVETAPRPLFTLVVPAGFS